MGQISYFVFSLLTLYQRTPRVRVRRRLNEAWLLSRLQNQSGAVFGTEFVHGG